jgi:hypothetical protein
MSSFSLRSRHSPIGQRKAGERHHACGQPSCQWRKGETLDLYFVEQVDHKIKNSFEMPASVSRKKTILTCGQEAKAVLVRQLIAELAISSYTYDKIH